ncbi:hypothetical protein OG21DRAFT_1504242 [Imleria badia]|nr:hypothetical protein OG21DRAFT_1504242 [Imleria badia]
MGNKRKNEVDVEGGSREKKAKNNTGAARNPQEKGTPRATSRAPDASADQPGPSQKPETQPRRPRIRKLAPSRPFPTVASASSVTGPRSTHHEGKNNICITRKTKLAAYLRRCKALLVDDGFKELRLSAMGAAIPHLALLAVSLPPILPWAEDEVHVDVFTGSLEVHDEVLSESGSEAEDGPPEEFRTRVKSTMNAKHQPLPTTMSLDQHRVLPRMPKGGPMEEKGAHPKEEVHQNGLCFRSRNRTVWKLSFIISIQVSLNLVSRAVV